jgi:SulP family sulfate permease
MRSSRYDHLLPIFSLGLVIGAIQLPAAISFAILIYSGALTPFAGVGIGMVLFGGLIIQLIVALTSSIPGIMGGPQDSPAAILGLMAAAIAAQIPDANAETMFATVVATVMLTSVLSGLFFSLIGGFKLGRFVRFIPYPVVGGFIAGTGLLLVQGALGVMIGNTPTLASLNTLFSAESLVRWIPSALLGTILVIGSRRVAHFLAFPALLAGAAILFYVIVWFSGQPISGLREAGWLLGPFPEGSLWRPWDLSLLAQVDWELIAGQASNIAAVALISIVALLLNSNALELIARRDIDLNRELIGTGLGNIVGGLAGSSVGYHYLGFSAVALRMNISSRLLALMAASVTGFVLLFGADLLSFMPTLLAGGVLFYLGFSFLVEWLYDAWFQLPRIDYALVVLILGVVGAFGFLQGVGVGIVIAILLFVVNYSRIDIVKDSLSGDAYQSRVERPFEQRELIRRAGQQIQILRLHGFLFFGTSQGLVQRVQERLKQPDRPNLKYLLLDFQHVTALDSSAVLSFVRLKQLAESQGFHLVLCDLTPKMKTKLMRAGLNEEGWIRLSPNMDYGMEWCESKLLVEEGGSAILRAGTLEAQLKKLLPARDQVNRFMSYLERQEVLEYHIVIHKGDPPDSMYFVDTGQLTTRLEISKGKFIRLGTQGGGTMVGEMGLFLKQSRTATVVASQPSVLYRLSLDQYHKMMREDPELAFHLHQWIGRVLSVRLAENNHTLEALLS